MNIQIKNYFQNPIIQASAKQKRSIAGKRFAFLEQQASAKQKRSMKGVPTAIAKNEKVFLFYEENNTICLAVSKDGINFKKYNKNPLIRERGARCLNPKITKIQSQYFLTYEVKKNNKTYLCGVLSKNLFKWEKGEELKLPFHASSRYRSTRVIGKITPNRKLSIVQDYEYNGRACGYFISKDSVKIVFSDNLRQWQVDTKKKAILSSRKSGEDKSSPSAHRFARANEKIEIGPSPIVTEQGILFFYNIVKSVKKSTKQFNKIYSWGLILFDKEDPSKILWKLKQPIFSSENNKIILGGLVKFQGKWFLYYYSEIDNGISVAIMDFYGEKEEKVAQLRKFSENPLLKPREKCLWESKGVFNAAAIYEQEKVYLIYRAVTENDISVLGLAISDDGINISERLTQPIYVPRVPFELNPGSKRTYNYLSGWGHSGCEDPRIVKIEDRIYMTYTAFDGGNPPGVALTSIKIDDFLNRKWQKWEMPVLISPFGELHKNWVIFPEKIDSKYAILHSISPKISVEYFDKLKFDNGKHIKSFYNGNCLKSRWESCTRGVGPPPIKTDKGWLILYHAIEDRDSGKYKLGAMLLDLKNPYQIIARSKRPVLEPEMINIGKPGVVYSCGAVVMKNQLFVYYGQNDYWLGVATANLNEFLEKLLT